MDHANSRGSEQLIEMQIRVAKHRLNRDVRGARSAIDIVDLFFANFNSDVPTGWIDCGALKRN